MKIPKTKVLKRQRRCKKCGEILDSILFTHIITEEWSWTGDGIWECSEYPTLVDLPHKPVRCPNCEVVVGTGLEFGFQHSATSLFELKSKNK